MTWVEPAEIDRRLVVHVREHQPDVYDLARRLALALRIEPRLLRNARLAYASDSDAGLEAALWQSALVDSSSTLGFTLKPGVARVLAEELAQKPREFDHSLALIEANTAHWHPRERLEQAMRWDARGGARATEGLKQKLQQVLRELIRTTQPAERSDIARWAKGVLPQLIASDHELEEAGWLAQFVAATLGDPGGAVTRHAGGNAPIPDWLWPKQTAPTQRPRSRLGLRWRTGVLECLAADAGTHNIEIDTPLPAPVFIQCEGSGSGRWELFWPDRRIQLPQDCHSLLIQPVAGQAYRLTLRRSTSSPADATAQSPAVERLVLSYVESDKDQAEVIVALLREAGVQVELALHADTTQPPVEDARSARVIRLWSQAALRQWQARSDDSEIPAPSGLVLRVDAAELPSAADSRNEVAALDWTDWRKARDSERAAQALVGKFKRWLNTTTGEPTAPDTEQSGAEGIEDIERIAYRTTANVNLRTGPGIDYAVDAAGPLAKDTRVIGLRRSHAWSLVETADSESIGRARRVSGEHGSQRSVFLSYALDDEARIAPIAEGLRQVGWVVHWNRGIDIGESWTKAIAQKLDEAACVIVFWSQHSVTSQWVTKEAAAGETKRKLVSVLLDDTRPPARFAPYAHVDLRDWQGDPDDDAFRALLTALSPYADQQGESGPPNRRQGWVNARYLERIDTATELGAYLEVLSRQSVIVCDHQSGIVSLPPGDGPLTERDLVGRPIVGCPNVGPGVKPCTTTLRPTVGVSEHEAPDGSRFLLDTLDGLTDGIPPGVVRYRVKTPAIVQVPIQEPLSVTASSAHTDQPESVKQCTLLVEQRGENLLRFEVTLGDERHDWNLTYQPELIRSLTESLIRSPRNDEDLAKTLARLLLPAEFADLPPCERYLLDVDRTTAGLPWELLLGAHVLGQPHPVSVIRQMEGYRTGLRTRPSEANALLIGNPNTEGTLAGMERGFPSLPGVVEEIRAVERALVSAGYSVTISEGEDAVAIMRSLFARDYQVLLIGGNSVSDYERPDGKRVSGFALNEGIFLTALEVRQMRVPPELVLLNGCYAGRIGPSTTGDLAGAMVPQLLKIGTTCCVAPGWAVDDAMAALFSEQLFTSMIEGKPFDQACFEARRKVFDNGPLVNTWAAYQAWGDPDYVMTLSSVARDSEQEQTASKRGNTLTEADVPAQVSNEIRRLLSEIADPNTEPKRRLEIGDALDRLGDPRKGIGLDQNGLPDIDWVEIPGGAFLCGEDKETRKLPTFYMARYPITNAQFQAFIDAGGYRDKRWWEGLAKRPKSPEAPRWATSNRPRETVSWYEAVAFCRWLSVQLGYEVRLPTEEEWEKAARGEDGRIYPWGGGYLAGYANVDERSAKAGPSYLEQTTAVGLYPQGASPYSVQDMSGNVWEWCLNEYEKPAKIGPNGAADRALRGGSWSLGPDGARASYRRGFVPDSRHYIGFRVLCSSPTDR